MGPKIAGMLYNSEDIFSALDKPPEDDEGRKILAFVEEHSPDFRARGERLDLSDIGFTDLDE